MKTAPIKTQDDLDEKAKEEKGMFYISLSGAVATFNGEYILNLIEAHKRLQQVAEGSSEAIKDAKKDKDTKEIEELIDVAMTTYLVPYRIH